MQTNQNTFDIVSNIAREAGLNDDFQTTYAQILAGVIDADFKISDYEPEDILEYLETIESDISVDFTFEFDGNEYRIISDSDIWDIYVQEIQQTVEDCYDINLDKIPAFIAVSIDWEQTAQNAYVDGYGHHFATYDGEEYQTENGEYWIFCTN